MSVNVVLVVLWALASTTPSVGASSASGDVVGSAPAATPPQQHQRRRGHQHHQPHCIGTAGEWCSGAFRSQAPAPRLAPPIFGRACPRACSGVGVCHGDRGACDCPAGWGGADCSTPAKRPCTRGYGGTRNGTGPASHIGPDGRDLDWHAPGSTYSRCAGICDDDIAACYCDPQLGNPKYGRIPAPPGSPPGTPPVQEGRPLFEPCSRLADDGKGNKLDWVPWAVAYDRVYGPKGWCVADVPEVPECRCELDGSGGPGCGLRSEMVCPNQCSGRGACRLGFCACDRGWWGLDCAHAATEAAAASAPQPLAPWLREVTVDAWRCAAAGEGCLEELTAAVDAEWRARRAALGGGGDGSSSGDSSSSSSKGAGHEELPLEGEDDPGDAFAGGGGSGGDYSGLDSDADKKEAHSSKSSSTLPAAVPSAAPVSGPLLPALVPEKPAGAAAADAFAAIADDWARGPAPAAAPLSPARRRRQRRRTLARPYPDDRDESSSTSSESSSSESSGGAPRGGRRRRPLIYVYDVPSAYVGRMLQYRMYKDSCVWRVFDAEYGNATLVTDYPYGTEPLLLELLLGSGHRTLDPEEADFFYVPLMSTCWFFPVSGWADHPWWYSDSYSRVSHAAVMAHELLQWVKASHPYWNRTGGADHIWQFTHDEGACWAPKEVYERSIIITHWGRMGLDHASGTTYGQDNYTADAPPDPWLPGGFRPLIRGHPCYTPGKDVVVPLFHGPERYRASPYLGAPPRRRDVLLFFRGRNRDGDAPAFSRGVRRRVAAAARAGGWARRYNIHVGGYGEVEGDYSELLARSVFCLVPSGDGFSARFDAAMLHGCLPVIVINGVVGPWGHQLRWRAFSVRVAEADVEKLPEILAAIPPARVRRMQRAAAAVWRRFAWLSHPAVLRQAHELMAANAAATLADVNGTANSSSDANEDIFRPRPLAHGGWRGDAFHTLLEWLHHKLALRGSGGGSGGIGIDEGGDEESQDRPPPPRHHRRRRRRRGGGGGDAASGGADEPSV